MKLKIETKVVEKFDPSKNETTYTILYKLGILSNWKNLSFYKLSRDKGLNYYPYKNLLITKSKDQLLDIKKYLKDTLPLWMNYLGCDKYGLLKLYNKDYDDIDEDYYMIVERYKRKKYIGMYFNHDFNLSWYDHTAGTYDEMVEYIKDKIRDETKSEIITEEIIEV